MLTTSDDDDGDDDADPRSDQGTIDEDESEPPSPHLSDRSADEYCWTRSPEELREEGLPVYEMAGKPCSKCHQPVRFELGVIGLGGELTHGRCALDEQVATLLERGRPLRASRKRRREAEPELVEESDA